MAYEHTWFECPLCGPVIRCGKCGNNCCNGSYGTVGGRVCDACPEAYEKQDREVPTNRSEGGGE